MLKVSKRNKEALQRQVIQQRQAIQATGSPAPASRPRSPSPTRSLGASSSASGGSPGSPGAKSTRNGGTQRTFRASSLSMTYRPKTARRAIKAKKRTVAPPRAVTLVALKISQKCDPDSRKMGSLLPGSVVYLDKTQELPNTGVKRAKVIVARDNAAPKGWVTVCKDGNWLVQLDGGPEAAAQIKWVTAKVKGQGAGGDHKGKEAAKESLVTVDNIRFTAGELTRLVEEQLSLASAASTLIIRADTLPAKLGTQIHVQKLDVDEYLRQWDLGSGSEITKMEFRRSVRTLVKDVGSVNSGDIDGLFDALDKDKGGSLDLSELKVAFKRMEQLAMNSEIVGQAAKERCARLKRLAATTQAAVDMTIAAEKAEHAMSLATAEMAAKGERSIDGKLSMMLCKRQTDVSKLTAKWGVGAVPGQPTGGVKEGTAVEENAPAKEALISGDTLVQHVKDYGLKVSNDERAPLLAAIGKPHTQKVTSAEEEAEGAAAGGHSLWALSSIEKVLKEMQEKEAQAQEEHRSKTREAGDLRIAAKKAQYEAYEQAKLDEAKREREDNGVLGMALTM